MAAEREPPSVTDYVVTGIGPALVMLMVGSLVFFLVEVLYAGKYSDRLLYTFFFFVMGAVLVARISIQFDAARATAYGLGLAIVTYLALLSYVEYPSGWLKSWGWLVNLGLMVVVWFSAHKLTWDCTHIDETRASSGRGLLSAAGLDADDQNSTPASGGHQPPEQPKTGPTEPARPGQNAKKKKKKKGKKAEPDSRLWDWIEKYKAHREEQRKAGHTPGVWVLYFALAALPLFALGQSLVDIDDDKRRRATFLQMTVYVASALALLVTTSLLGVRRYLRQRKAKVPIGLTLSWLGLGGVLIVVFLALGAFLPRPHSEVPWFGIERAGKSDREASKYAQLSDSAGKGEGRGGNQSKAGDGNASGKGGQPGGGSKGDKGGGGKGQGGKGGKSKGDQSGGKDKGGGKGKGDDSEAKKDDSNDRDSKGNESEDQEDTKDEGKSGERDTGSPSRTPLGGVLDKVAGVVKWLVFALVAVLVIFGLFFGVLKYLAPFTDWARRWLEGIRAWWASLFGPSSVARKTAAAEAQPLAPVRPPPFSAYSNPFADGTAEGRDTAELVAYTFEALDAWAWDRDSGREPTETPLEFVGRLGEAFPDHANAYGKLATLYARMAYSRRPLPATARSTLEAAWEQMVHGASVSV
ncbi:DUF4129 domain-containing protein [Frigoriglobus tundricola]|uniref:Protein-glutamine gamma-glutamyltransferase-like C-terminal domain-containing protein n=1 Tax=Frigoriglobus tundricola TaxID=2774151 RepID=A0A6M5Z043_9BACT|nr:DUF4129 domain-containing protein [Frigoriglobus tundricola]QJW99518.1 hypothetical protein FTUN_7130 [Frigoriglobus tundricola]